MLKIIVIFIWIFLIQNSVSLDDYEYVGVRKQNGLLLKEQYYIKTEKNHYNDNILDDSYYNIISYNNDEDNDLIINSNDPPFIDGDSDDKTIQYGKHFNLNCKSNVQITWVTPSKEITVITNKSNDEKYPYTSTVKLLFVNDNLVGEYFCIEKNAQKLIKNLSILKSKRYASSIYIYVNDTFTTFVIPKFSFLTIQQYEIVTIPCKPTIKDIPIKFIKVKNRFSDNKLSIIEKNYDPRYGFTIVGIKAENFSNYNCIAYDGSIKSIFELKINPSKNEIIGPNLLENNLKNVNNLKDFYAFENDNLTFECKIEKRKNINYLIQWTLPNGKIINITENLLEVEENGTISSKLHLINVNRLKDQGNYFCDISYLQKHYRNQAYLTIYNSYANNINMSTEQYLFDVTPMKQSINFTINYEMNINYKFKWFNNKQEEIIQIINNYDNKYKIIINETNIILTVNNLTIFDNGNYTLKAYYQNYEKNLQFQLIVRDKPIVSVSNLTIKENQNGEIICNCSGYPRPTITWTYQSCSLQPYWPFCNDSKIYSITTFETKVLSPVCEIAILKLDQFNSGKIMCHAENDYGKVTAVGEIKVMDLDDEMVVWRTNSNDPIIIGDTIIITCGVSSYNFRETIKWSKNSILFNNTTNDRQIKEYFTKYSQRTDIMFNKIKLEDSGNYTCHGIFNKTITINVQKPILPIANIITSIEDELTLGDSVKLKCLFGGFPISTAQWLKDNSLISPDENDTRITIEQSNSSTSTFIIILNIEFILNSDEGTYKCFVKNQFGSVSDEIIIKTKKIIMYDDIFMSVCLVILGIISLIFAYMTYRIRKLKAEKSLAYNILKGNINEINPSLPIDQQAFLLPYDKKFEISRDNLSLGKHLGEGNFGIVYKAYAKNLKNNISNCSDESEESSTIVAVKTYKDHPTDTILEAFISELKIMIHLGQHSNIVNLLGAVTKNVKKMMIIVEYCRYGNVKTFLLNNRNIFVNQLHPITDKIDSEILTKEQREMKWCNNLGTKFTNDLITIENDDESDKSFFYSYNMDINDLIISSITTSDLVIWSFQISRGMNYLISRNILHNDLAARNILLCDGNIVKICDFGLARTLYKTSENFKLKDDCPLPVRWLSVESMNDNIFNKYTDIWSYGILLWELFSLSQIPYPNIKSNQILYNKLKNGYRMGKPTYANNEIYELMLDCWNSIPESRPLFSNIEIRLGKMLENSVEKYYVDLNKPFRQTNNKMFSDGQLDYLAMIGLKDGITSLLTSNEDDINNLGNVSVIESPSKNITVKENNQENLEDQVKIINKNIEFLQFESSESNNNPFTTQQSSEETPLILDEVPMTNFINFDCYSNDDTNDDTNDDSYDENNKLNIPPYVNVVK